VLDTVWLDLGQSLHFIGLRTNRQNLLGRPSRFCTCSGFESALVFELVGDLEDPTGATTPGGVDAALEADRVRQTPLGGLLGLGVAQVDLVQGVVRPTGADAAVRVTLSWDSHGGSSGSRAKG